MQLDEDINDFIVNFFGFGGLSSKTWFIGYEEAGGEFDLFKEIYSRKNSPYKNAHTADIRTIHNNNRFLRNKSPLQTTWAKLIRIYLNSIGTFDPDKEDIRIIQGSWWGEYNRKCCLLEHFPLPNINTSEWFDIYYYISQIYKSNLGFLKNRKMYEKKWMNFVRKKLLYLGIYINQK